MRSRLMFATLVLSLLTPSLALAAPVTWTVDRAHSRVGFVIRHLMTRVSGQFGQVEGVLVHDPERPEASTVRVTAQAASIDTGHERRDGHLRSADFFDVESYPTVTFVSRRVAAGENRLEVTGDLTMHGVTREITVPVEILGFMGDKAGFATTFTVDRKDYGITWNRALDAGGALLGDEVTVDIQLQVNREKPEGPAEAAD